MNTRFFIKGIGACCPDPCRLPSVQFVCTEVDAQRIPAAMRRRTSLTTRMAITAAYQACSAAGVDPAQVPSVFASLGGEMQVTDALCRLLPLPEALLSPTQFHNSVHNTTAGYWGIINQCQAATTAIAALDDTFAMGLLEACSQIQLTGGDRLLVCYDEAWPQYLAPPLGQYAFACALLLSSDAQGAVGALTMPTTRSSAEALDIQWQAAVAAAPATAAIPLLNATHQSPGARFIPLNTQGEIWFTQFEKV